MSADPTTTAAAATLPPIPSSNGASQQQQQDPRCLEVVVESVPLGDVLDDDFLDKKDPSKRFNTNNHWDGDGGAPPADYDNVFFSVCTGRWIDAFHRACVLPAGCAQLTVRLRLAAACSTACALVGAGD